MDYTSIAAGIIKNAEMYELYSYYQIEKNKNTNNAEDDFITTQIIGTIARLYKSNVLKSKNVLTLLDYINSISSNKKELKKMYIDMTHICVMTDIYYAKAMINDHPWNLQTRLKSIRARKAIKKITNNGNGETFSEFMKEANRSKIDKIIQSYNINNDIRYKNSKYHDALKDFIPDKELLSLIESILDAPTGVAEKAYTFALAHMDEIESNMQKKAKTNASKEQVKAECAISKMKYTLCCNIAQNAGASPENLKRALIAKKTQKEGL